MFVSINWPGDLDLRPFDLETGMRVASKVGNLHSKFGYARLLGSRIIRYVLDERNGHTDRQTDGQKQRFLNPSIRVGAQRLITIQNHGSTKKCKSFREFAWRIFEVASTLLSVFSYCIRPVWWNKAVCESERRSSYLQCYWSVELAPCQLCVQCGTTWSRERSVSVSSFCWLLSRPHHSTSAAVTAAATHTSLPLSSDQWLWSEVSRLSS